MGNATPHLKFIIDRNYDLEMIPLMVNHGNLQNTLPEPLFKATREDDPESYQDQLKKFVDEEYQCTQPYLEKTRSWYQDSWNKINDQFFQLIAEKTNYPWQFDDPVCVVSLFHQGISNWGGKVIARWWKENPFTMRRITAHELIIPHYFNYVREHFVDKKLEDEEIWQLAEIAAWAFTGLDDDLKNFWPWDQSGYYTNHNYPELVDLQLKLKSPFLERESFEEYVEKGIGLVK